MPSSGKGQERRYKGIEMKRKLFQTVLVFQYFQGKLRKLSKYRYTIYNLRSVVMVNGVVMVKEKYCTLIFIINFK